MCVVKSKKEGNSNEDTNRNSHSNLIDSNFLTHSCESSLKKRDSLHAKSITKKRVVRFHDAAPEIINTMKPSSVMSNEEKSQIFWQVHDHEYFRRTARFIASEIRKLSVMQQKKSSNYDIVLTRTYLICSSSSTNNEEDHQAMFEGKKDLQDFSKDDDLCLPPNVFASLARWSKAGHSRRGLEKFSVPHLMQTRPLARQDARDAVLITQDLLTEKRDETHKNGGKIVSETSDLSFDLPDDEILRMVSEKYTKTSRKFATCMGHADAAAVGNYEYTNNP
jgi:hypothetical protein